MRTSALKSAEKIGVVTATRAEYGLFLPLLTKIRDGREFHLQLYVTGTHLSHEFGFTRDRIIEDGFDICEDIDCLIGNDTPDALGKTSGLALMGLAVSFNRHRPDLIILLGDRYETLCAAIAASLCRIPIAHLHGGEITEGAYDNGFRHAITKLSHLHFTSSEEHRERVLQMGENPELVFNVGAIGLDNLVEISPMKKSELEKNLGIRFQDHNLLITLHPETLEPGASGYHVNMLIDVLRGVKNCTIIITGANADSEGRIINQKMKEFAEARENCIFVPSLGQKRYISILHIVNVVIGNSSSGIIEVPFFGIPVVNIGNRQKGRMKSRLVMDVSWNPEVIAQAVQHALSGKTQGGVPSNPYGEGNTARRIIEVLKSKSFNKSLLVKKFFDISKG